MFYNLYNDVVAAGGSTEILGDIWKKKRFIKNKSEELTTL